jgi:uncharacterized protein
MRGSAPTCNKTEIIKNTEKHVRETLEKDSSGHDWWHVERVRKLALQIAEQENNGGYLCKFTVELAALLHDIADHKFHGGDETIGPKTARTWLESQNVEESIIVSVCDIIKHISFKGAHVDDTEMSPEGKVVQDADRLDAIGAIGVARAFAYGGYKGHAMHDPDQKLVLHKTKESYKANKSTAINHFYEKLLLVKDRINTQTGKKIAQQRHNYMLEFLKTFENEWGP